MPAVAFLFQSINLLARPLSCARASACLFYDIIDCSCSDV